ncbi:ABC transporter ATP-binding protein [Cohnella mopanensis]|uniref:ABC transporter ATP-binding protein n=1 Tax=Cohnella mopanensis TaxID=2911966 RepID=UPI001EF8823C|nr:ABC transporter ATP-binding protein [Cohnella mopanensis]
MSFKELISRSILNRSAKDSRRYLLMAVMTALGGALADMAIALSIMRLADAGLSGDENTAIRMSIYMAAAVLVGFLLKFTMKAAATRFGANTAYKLRSSLFAHMAKIKQSEAESRHAGDWMSVLSNDAFAVEQFFTYHLCNLLFHPIMATGTFVFLLLLQWKLVLLCCLIMPLSLLISWQLGKPIIRKSQQLQEIEGAINSQIQDAVIGQALIKSYERQNWLRERFERILKTGLFKSFDLERQRSFIIPWQILLQTLPFAFCILYGGWLAIHGDMRPAALLAFIYLLGYCIQSASALPELIGQLFVATGAVRRLNQIMDYQTEEGTGTSLADTEDRTSPNESESVISFNEVNFQYAGRSVLALNDISYEVRKGQFVAIVGPSGSGKSTIMKLLSKLYEPNRGEIRLFGKSLADYNPQAARSMISFVKQHTFLFPGTILDNIRHGKPLATDKEVVEASVAAGADSFIQQLPDSYLTQIGERGAGLSGGQMQRIAIARALLKEAPIVVFDEPTSALDGESEAIIQETLRQVRRQKTIIVIAHRLSTVQDADLILVMDQGRIVESGTHEQLMRHSGLYSGLYQNLLEGVS